MPVEYNRARTSLLWFGDRDDFCSCLRRPISGRI